MYCTCRRFRNNPIRPEQLLKVLTLAIWPTSDSAAVAEAEAARKMSIRFLAAVKPVDIPQLQDVLGKLMGPATSQPGALAKLLALYQEAIKNNPILPPPNIGQGRKPTPKPTPKVTSPPPITRPSSKAPPPRPKASTPPPGPTAPGPDERRGPLPRQACRACDGRGSRKKVDKENVMKETVVMCSRCGGSGREPPPSTKKGRGGRRGPYVEETEEEEDINKKTDNFLKRHGFDKWGG